MATNLDLTDLDLDEPPPAASRTVSFGDAAEIFDPTNGELIDPTNADALIEAFVRIREFDSRLFAAKRAVQAALLALSDGDSTSKTRRVRGRVHRAKLTLPSDGWSQPLLKEAWHAYPQFRDEVLRIDAIGVKAREFAKFKNETGPEDWSQFKRMVEGASQPATAMPTITVEA